MATRLGLYNQALRICGERSIAALTEAREPRYLLDQVWTTEDAVSDCLEQGLWNFATRSVQIDYDTSVSPSFGLAYGFTKPTDWVRTAAFCSDERYQAPYRAYVDEPGYWYADITPIYVKYVSDDASFGGNLSAWPGTFSDFVAAFMASKIITKLTSDKERLALVDRARTRAKRDAMNKDAMNNATRMPAPTSWQRARFGRGNLGNFDGGNSGSLIG